MHFWKLEQEYLMQSKWYYMLQYDNLHSKII